MRWICVSVLVANLVLSAIIIKSYQQEKKSDMTVVQPILSGNKRLVLLHELEATEESPESVETVRLNSSQIVKVAMAEPRELCTLVGSFDNINTAQLFVEKLAVFDVQAKVKHLLIAKTIGYWLHITPLGSRKELLQYLGDLQRQGIDSYIIPDGDLKNGISLGMFSESDRAIIMQKKVANLGYEAAISEVPREKREVRVFMQQQESTKINQERWSELISGKDLLQKQQNLCSDVASR